MKRKFLFSLVLIATVSCSSKYNPKGLQYIDGEFQQAIELVDKVNATGSPINQQTFLEQIGQVKQASPSLYQGHASIYQALRRWIKQGAHLSELTTYGVISSQMAGVDNRGNVLLTGYYTPVIHARYQPDNEFRFPLYTMPSLPKHKMPSREQIYAGVLSGKGLELAYSRSLIDNFIMGVQGSAYINFNDGLAPTFFAYKGKNNHPYSSVGRILVEQGEVEKEKISMQAIRQWAEKNGEQATKQLLIQNRSYVFYQPQGNVSVTGASGVPLLDKSAVAADRRLIKPGSVLLIEYPLLDKEGCFSGRYELRLALALDVGGAIKGQHLDVYQGIGDEAGHAAGFYNHYGRVWLLHSPAGGAASSPVQ